jgi:hypothetical protein
MAAFARFRVANCGPLFFTLPLRPHPVHRARWRSCHSTRLRLTGSRRPRTRTASTHCLEHYLCARPQEEARIIGLSNPVKTLRKSAHKSYRNPTHSITYRVPPLPTVPLNSPAYFCDCPTLFDCASQRVMRNRKSGRQRSPCSLGIVWR